jgi:hypothetical protein
MACTIQSDIRLPPAAQEAVAATPLVESAATAERIDASQMTPPTPALRQKLLRLIIDRETQRKIQRDG